MNHFINKDLLINRVLVYGVLILFLSGLFLVTLGVFSVLARRLLVQENQVLVVFMAMLVVLLALIPLRLWVQRLIDRTFYKERARYRELLPKMGASLQTNIVFDAYSDLLTDELPQRLEIESAALYLLDGNGMVYLREDGASGLSADHPLVTSMKGRTAPINRALSQDWVPDQALNWMVEHGFALSIPLLFGDELIGIYNLGLKLSGRAFRFDEVRLLSEFMEQAAVGLQSRRLLQAEQEQRLRAEELAERMAALLDETNRRSDQLQAINAIIAVAVAAPDLPHLLDSMLDLIMEALGQESGGLLVSGHLYNRGIPEVFIRYCLQATQAIGWVGSSTIVVNDWRNVSDASLANWSAKMLDVGIHSSLIVPVMVGGSHTGVLTLSSTAPKDWHEDDVALVKAVVRQLASAIERLELLSKTQEQARQVQRIVDTVPDGVLLLDDYHQIVLANPAARQHLIHLVGDNWHERTLVNLAGIPIESLLEQSPQQPWTELICDGAPHRIYEIAARPVFEQPKSAGWVVVLRDVTIERENQSQIQMQERLATVGQLAAGIAHDFNNIMAAIQVYVDLFSMDGGISDEGQARLDIVKNQIGRATSLIRQILDFSRRSVMEQSPMDLLPLIKEQEKLLRRLLPENIQVELRYQPGSYLVRADPTRLQQMLLNLSLNARDAMPSGGLLRFTLSRLTLTSEEHLPFPDISPGDWIKVCVSDTGSGIPESVLPHVFDPFFTTKEVGQGTGLGLAQVYGIVKGHHGFIDLNSEPGKGAEFTIFLPQLVAEEVQTVEEFTVEGSRGAGETVLVAEDDPITRDAVRVLLESLNYHVMTASNGMEALQIYEKSRGNIDLLVCDLVMPEMDGIPLYYAIKDDGGGQALKCLFFSGHPMDLDEMIAEEGGQVDWLKKPFSVQEFAAAVRRMMSR